MALQLGELGRDLKYQLRSPVEGHEIKQYHIMRCLLQLSAPQCDALTKKALPIYEKFKGEFSGSILDVGCYAGWLLGFLQKDNIDIAYTGLDRWKAAIEAARYIWGGGGSFVLGDAVEDFGREYGVIWVSQIHFRPEQVWHQVCENCFKHTGKICIVTAVNLNFKIAQKYAEQYGGDVALEKSNGLHVVIYRK